MSKNGMRWTTNPDRRHPPTNSDEAKKLLAHVERQRTAKGWRNGAWIRPKS